MTQVSGVAAPTRVNIGEAIEEQPLDALPSPLLDVSEDTTDALMMLMAAMVRMADLGITESETKITLNTKLIHSRYQDYLKRVEDARQEAKEEGGGLFGSLAKKLASLLTETVGGAADFMKEVADVQLDVVSAVLPGDVEHFLSGITQELEGLTSEWQERIDGFVEGTIRFSCDVAAFSVMATGGVAVALADGQPLDEAALGEVKGLMQSARKNLLENEGFMEVASVLGKGAAMAAAIGTGGALAPVALGVLLAISELDSRYQILDELGGAAPYARIGVTAATITVGLTAGGANTAKVVSYLQSAVGVINGAAQVNAGVRGIEAANDRLANAKREAAMKETLQRVAQLQRLQDDLIAAYQEHVKAKTGFIESGARLFQIRAETNAASVLRA
ncbi:MAG: hypothetical protein KIT72_06925 [Polyangiaceae bacterium]|nr:hypothetical protein [Polyangiaceae bacterium]MCW5790137.1 hypothetical protein [Polyangiaceae bacterium]